MREEAKLCVALLDTIFGSIWTRERLTDAEKEAIEDPMAGVIYKHGGQIPIEWQLAAAIGFAAAPRFVKYRAAQRASERTIEVK